MKNLDKLKWPRFQVISFLVLCCFFAGPAYACLGCGETQSITPKLLLVGLGFFFMPAGFVAFIVWRLWKDSKSQR